MVHVTTRANAWHAKHPKRRLPLVYLAAACTGMVGTAAGQRIDSVTTTQLAPGVIHRRLIAGDGPWTINLIAIDLRQPGISIRAAHADGRLIGRETVSAIARRATTDSTVVVAAINADFFDLKTGAVENNQVIDGEIWKASHTTDAPQDNARHVHTQFAVGWSGQALMDTFAVDARMLRARHPPLALAGVNYRPGVNTSTLYTPRFGTITPADPSSRTVEIGLRPLGVRGDTASFQVAGRPTAGGTTALVDTPVLSLAIVDTAGNVPRPGEIIRIVVTMQPATTPLRTLVGGWPRLVVHGRSVADSADRLEGTFPSFSIGRHPRTGIGFSRDSTTLYLLTVDGRQESSSGMSLAEFAALMIQLGVYEGLNLDGGGSTAMVIDGRVVNRPSDPTGERAIGNALLVVRSWHE